MEIKMGHSVSGYIQAFHTLMYKIPQMIHEEMFSPFMRFLEPRIHEQIGYHVEGDLSRARAMAEKTDVWQTGGEGKGKEQKKQKARSSG